MEKNISVIIPAHNEEEYIGIVVNNIKKEKCVKEIIVVDNLCTDRTAEIAKDAGARVIECKQKGKGYAMEEGIKNATYNIIAFLDGDIVNYVDNVVEKMTNFIVQDQADFIKTKFDREGGRVTELLAKPLLNILFPELATFAQPLSGAIAGKKEWFNKIQLEKDYGVDIGILIDMHKLGARIKEVNIGNIKNNSQDWKAVTKMAHEVANAILTRSDRVK